MTVPVVIQAGGKGTRLYPYTTILPKPLMPVGEMPILEIVIRQLVRCGFRDLYISTSHLAHLIEAYFGDGSALNAHVTYVREEKPLGTIGPVTKIPRPQKPFIVMNGDILTDLDFRVLYNHHLSGNALLTVAVFQEKVPVSLGVIDWNDKKQATHFREKPFLQFWASMGIYVFSPELWDIIPSDTYYGFDTLMLDLLQAKREVMVYPWNGIWLDIGRPEDYQGASDIFQNNRDRLLTPGDFEGFNE